MHMASYLMTWVPKWYGIDRLRSVEIARSLRGETIRWSTGKTKRIVPGDRLFALAQGESARGIFGLGIAVSPVVAAPRKHRNREIDGEDPALYVDCRFEVLLDPIVEPMLSLDLLRKRVRGVNWQPRCSGFPIQTEAAADQVTRAWKQHLGRITRSPAYFAEDIPLDLELATTEGNRQLIHHLRIERDPKVVARAKAFWSRTDLFLRCSCCKFSFREAFGDRGGGFIEAHHRKPLGDLTGEERAMTKIEDLVPVCANCHRMLHRLPSISVEGLATSLKEYARHAPLR